MSAFVNGNASEIRNPVCAGNSTSSRCDSGTSASTRTTSSSFSACVSFTEDAATVRPSRKPAAGYVPGYTVTDPHTFLSNIGGASGPLAVAAQQQIATFLASGGTVTIDPDGPGPFFETPIAGPLPEGLNFLP